jgi:hypothetical protein
MLYFRLARAIGLLSGIAALAVAAGASAATVASNQPLHQQWVKRGVVLKPGFAGPASAQFVSSPSVLKLKNGRLRMYVWVADDTPPWLKGRQIVIAAESDPARPLEWTVLQQQEMVGPAAGSLRDRGVGFPYVLPRDDGPWLMYFGTWGGNWSLKRELLNRLGVAVSDDAGITWKVVDEDIVPSGPAGSFDSGAIPSAAVLREGKNDYRMWYTAAGNYVRFGEVNQGTLNIGMARSRDGIRWQKSAAPAMLAREEAAEPYEACLARPAILKLGDVYHMWFGVYDMAPGSRADPKIPAAGGSYRLEYARSADGVNWTRFPDQPVMPLTPGAFDSTSQTYASVVDMGDEIWMYYTGDGLGTTGVGWATLDKKQLRDE